MKVTLKKLPKSLMELTVEVPYETYQKWHEEAIREVGKNIKVSGFRQGHVPDEIVRQNVPESALLEHTLSLVITQTYAQAVQEHKVAAIAQPKVEVKQWVKKEGDPFLYVAVVAVVPEVSLKDYKKIKVTREKVEVKEKQLVEVMTEILDRFAEFHDVERAAQKNDRVEIDFEGFDKEGKAIPNTASKNHPLVLGSQTFIPGFEEAVMGMKKAETKEFDITFPKEYHDAKLKGAKVKFRVTLHRLEEKKVPELNEETIEKITQKKQSVDDFKKQVETDLRAELEYRAKQDQENKIIDAMIKATHAEIPDTLIGEELKFLLDNQKEYLKNQGLSWEQYLTHSKKTEDDFFKENRDRAEKNILGRLAFQHILREEKITVTEEELGPGKDAEGRDRLKNKLSVEKVMALFAA